MIKPLAILAAAVLALSAQAQPVGRPTPSGGMIVMPPPPPPPALMPGPARSKQSAVLLARPQLKSNVEGPVPAGVNLKLQVRQTNRDGAWWYTEYQGYSGWIQESALAQ